MGDLSSGKSRYQLVLKSALYMQSVFRGQELCESRGGRPGLPVPNDRQGLCGRKATLNNTELNRERTDFIRDGGP